VAINSRHRAWLITGPCHRCCLHTASTL